MKENFIIKSIESDKEFCQVLKILAENFPKHSLSYHRNRLLNDPTCSPSSTRILVEAKKIISTLRIYRRYMYIKGKKILFAGIGNVATIRERQRRGYASILLKNTIDLLKDEGFPLVMLFTKLNEFYEKFGFHTVVRKNYIITKEFVKNHCVTFNIVPVKARTLRLIRALSNIYEQNYSNSVGPHIRSFNYWRSQFKFCQDDRDKFLLGVNNNEIISFIRARQYNKEIAIFEFGSLELKNEPFKKFLRHYFEKFRPDFISIMANRQLAGLLGIEKLPYENQNELMIKTIKGNFKGYIKARLENRLFREDEILTWQSDFF